MCCCEALRPAGRARSGRRWSAIVVAADQTFKDVIARRPFASDDAIDGLDRSAPAASTGALGAAVADARRRGRRNAEIAASRNSSRGPLIPAAEWPALIEILESGRRRSDKDHIAALSGARFEPVARASKTICRVFCTSRAGAAQNHRHQEDRRRNIPIGSRDLLADEQARSVGLDRARARASRRDRTGRARHHRGRGDRALPPREGAPRACSTTTT